MSVAMIGPKFYGFGSDGKPLAFGKLYTYQARTNTPKPTYQSEDQVVENTNPVILNGEGYANVYLSGSYKMVLKDKDENEIWSSDPVSESTFNEWVNCVPATYASTTAISVVGNVTDKYTEGRSVRIDNNTSEYGYSAVISSSFAGGNTLITVADPVVTTGVIEICASVVGPESAARHNTDVSRNEVTAHDAIYSRNFKNISDLKNGIDAAGQTIDMTQIVGSKVFWRGYYAESDGGSNWGIVKSGSHTEDGGSIFSIDATHYVEANLKGKKISIKKWGAKGDKTQDDTDFINAAASFIPVSGGGLSFPYCDGYLVTKSLIARNDQTWSGDSMNGSKIIIGAFIQDGYKDSVIQTETEFDLSRFHLHDLTIDGEGGSGAANAIKIYHAVQCNLEDLYVRQSTGVGIRIKNPLSMSMNNIYVNAPQSEGFYFQMDADTGIIKAGNLFADNGQNVPALYATQTTQANCTLLVDSLRFEGGWSQGAFVESFTQTSDNGIYFECKSIRAFANPHPSAVDPCICEIHNKTQYRIGEITGNVSSNWTNKFAQYNGTRPSPLSDATYYSAANTKDGQTSGDLKFNREGKSFSSLGQVDTVTVSSEFSGSYTGNVMTLNSESTSALASSNFLRCLSGGVTDKALILGDGSFQSATNSYTGISDIRYKDIIGDARDYTEDVLKHKLVKYTLKSDPDKAEMLGLIAQDVQEYSPGLIQTTFDYEEVKNEDGSISYGDPIPESERLAVKYSVINLEMLSALQATIVKQREIIETQAKIIERLDKAGI